MERCGWETVPAQHRKENSMSHRQKNKHKSRHRIHANNGPRVAQVGRVAPGQVKAVTTAPDTAPTETVLVAADTATVPATL